MIYYVRNLHKISKMRAKQTDTVICLSAYENQIMQEHPIPKFDSLCAMIGSCFDF